MKNLRKSITVLTAILAGAGIVSGGVIACSSDDTVTTTDGGPETGSDAPIDNTNPPPQDGGQDVVVVEAGTLAEFIAQNATATCLRYKECCAATADAGTDAGTFNLTQCNADFAVAGWDQSLYDLNNVPGVADGGRIVFDPVAAAACLTAIRNMTCKNTTATEYRNAWEKCYAAASGTSVPGDGGCRSNVECVKTAYCNTTQDGGQCVPLIPAGTACTQGPPPAIDDQCSYRGAGTTGCEDPGDGGPTSCATASANGKDCTRDFDCLSGACSPVFDDAGNLLNGACSATADFLYGICDLYKQ
jgi:hypothetical protein